MSERSRTVVKLFCPSVSKIVPVTVGVNEQKLDIGSIARAFGIEPSTLRLNGHFISRGVDLISSSVTWKSLLSFFAARGLSTGTSDLDALVVDGKLCRPGTKRVGNHSDTENGDDDHQNTEDSIVGIKRKLQLEEVNLLKKNKIDRPPASKIGTHEPTAYSGIGLKRKSWLDDVNPVKKIRMNTGSTAEKTLPTSSPVSKLA